MGAYGSERTTQSLQDFPVVDSEEEAEEVISFLFYLRSSYISFADPDRKIPLPKQGPACLLFKIRTKVRT